MRTVGYGRMEEGSQDETEGLSFVFLMGVEGDWGHGCGDVLASFGFMSISRPPSFYPNNGPAVKFVASPVAGEFPE